MARPRKPYNELTKAAIWKRAHRDKVGYAGAKPGNKGDKPVGGTCQNCGKTVARLDLHHVGNNYKSGGATRKLCRSCHNKMR